MQADHCLTPSLMLAQFADGRIDTCRRAISELRKLEPEQRQAFLKPTISFMSTEKEDGVRTWGTTALGVIGGDEAYATLHGLLDTAMPEQKKDFSWTRLYALRAACSLARGNANREQQVADLVRTMAEDEDEPDVVSAAARARLASQGDRKSEARLRGELKNPDEFWLCLSAIRGLREFPVPRLADALLALLRENRYRDLVFQAIRALAREEYRSSVEVARGMADIVRLNPARHLRLEAVKALAVLQHRDTQNDLLRALADEDAEIRAQASAALAALLTVEEAVAAIVLEVLSDDLDPETWGRLVGGLRLVDITREISTRVLGAEIDGPDPERAKRAERTLTELGGGAALQRLTQRRRTLTDLDKVLKPALPI